MAFTTLTAGDRLILADAMNVHPKVPKSGYTPQVGDIVTLTGSGEQNDGVDLLAATESIYGIVINLNSWTSADVTRPISVAAAHAGFAVTLPYTSTVAVGDKVGFSSNTRDVALARTKVTRDNSSGTGKVTAFDAGTQYGMGFCVVEFP